MKLFCIIGEESGDNHAGTVLKELKKHLPELKIIGTGGPKFRELSSKTFFHAEDMAVIGFWEILKRRKYYTNLLKTLVETIHKEKPDFLFLVDYPGLNLRLAKQVKNSVPKIIYYISPQVWAWKKKRAFLMKRLIDLMITLFPFEVDFLKDYAGMSAICFGHPILDTFQKVSEAPPAFEKEKGKIDVCLLPGSRLNEIRKFLPILCDAVRLAKKQMPQLRFSIIKAGQISYKDYLKNGYEKISHIPLIDENPKNHIFRSDLAWCCSGTASLECASLKTPPLIFYQTSALSALIYRQIVKSPCFGMPNLLLKRKIFPEISQKDFNPENLLKTTKQMLQKKELMTPESELFKSLHATLGEKNAYQNTAKHLIEYLKKNS